MLFRFKLLFVAVVVGLTSLTPFGIVNAKEAVYDQEFFSKNNILFYNPKDVGCSSNGGTVTKLSGADNRQKIWNYFIARGLSPEQAAGVLGNIQSESGGTFSPTINEFSQTFPGGGYGIVQWTNSLIPNPNSPPPKIEDPNGRRANLVKSLTASNPDLMTKYYNAAYSSKGSYTDASQGFVSKNKDTGELMPVADNDALLLTELNFMLDETMARNLHQPAIDKSYGSASDKEWDVLKKQKTIADASNVWVYSFEIPADIDTTAVVRAQNGQTIYNLYSNSASGSSCSGDSKQELAKQIIASGNLFYDGIMTGPEREQLPNIASGSNNGNDWPCGININILKTLAAIVKEHKIFVTSLNRACFNDTIAGSQNRHYNGNGSAIDFGAIDGVSSYSVEGANLILKYMGPFLVSVSGVGQTGGACLPEGSLNLPPGVSITRFSDSCNHLHVDVPPNVDPALKCKLPVSRGGCDASQQV